MYEYAAKVDRVVDGDTVDVTLDLGFSIQYQARVRLLGINTPESRTRDKAEKAEEQAEAAAVSSEESVRTAAHQAPAALRGAAAQRQWQQ